MPRKRHFYAKSANDSPILIEAACENDGVTPLLAGRSVAPETGAAGIKPKCIKMNSA
jgi:hypothetical protein